MFSTDTYHDVAEAYIKGLEQRHAAGKSIKEVCSVASIFVSRVDTKIDKHIEAKIEAATDEAEKKKTTRITR